MKKALFTVTLLLASQLCQAQRIFESTNGSWDQPNLSVETFKDVVITGFTETNPYTGLLCPSFKITNTGGSALNSYYVDFPDDMYLMDFTMREATHTIIMVGMTVQTGGGTPHKMFVAEVDFISGAPYQSFIEYNGNGNSMIPHQVIHSEQYKQVMIVGTEVVGTLDPSNFDVLPKSGFVLGLDINDYSKIVNSPIEVDYPAGYYDYDMLENITEVPGSGYFISGSSNSPSGEQNLHIMGVDYGVNPTFTNIIDNTNSRMAGVSVMYNKPLDVVYVLANNSVIHQFQIAAFNPYGGGIGSAGWISHQFTAFPIGGGVDQNAFRLQQTEDNLILVGGYLSAPFGALSEQLTPFQLTMKDDLSFVAAKLFGSGNNSPLSPSYFEENGNSVFINTPDMFVYNRDAKRTYLVSQNTNYGGYDLNSSSVLKADNCEKNLKRITFTMPDNPIDVANFNPLPMYPAAYFPNPINRPINEFVLCAQAVPVKLAVTGSDVPGASLYPNPATEQLSITLEDGETISSVTIVDLKGNTILVQAASERTQNELTLGISQLSPGTYIAVISTKEGETLRERFVKD